jgi:cysteine desulfurase
MLSLTAHKFGGPKGVGALVVNPAIQNRMMAQLTGGAQERNRRAGTENTLGIIGLGAACEDMQRQSHEPKGMAELMDMLVQGLKALPVHVVAPAAAKVPHVVQVRTPGRKGEDMVIAMDMAGVAVSQGSACSSGRIQSSHVLQAMGFSAVEAGEGLRFSVGWNTTAADIAVGLDALRRVLT